MIDDEGNGIGLVAPVDSGRCGAIGESHSSTTAAPPAARPDAPQGAALESAPERAVAARRFRFRVAARPAAVARRPMGAAPSAPSRCGKRGQQVRRWLERRGRRAVRPPREPDPDAAHVE